MSNLSGSAWWHANQANFPNSAKVSALDPSFRPKVEAFIGALTAAGAQVNVTSTLRNKKRAFLMHYCWDVAHGLIAPSQVPPEPGVDIVWDHGNTAASRAAAQEMVDLFGIAVRPSLTSLHISGLAIDMLLDWNGTLQIKNAAGQTVTVTGQTDGMNPKLHEVGQTYGVIKLLSDPPHWSSTGH